MARGVALGPRFRDGLGVRVVEVDQASGDTVEVLHLCQELCAFEKAIKDRTDRLSSLRHPRFTHIRGVRAVSGPHSRLGVVADHIVGPRLSEVLEGARNERVGVDANAALHLIRELLTAVSALHASRKATHGAIAPERLIVTPRGRLVIVDYTLGLALERLQYNRARLWRDFHIATPPPAGAAKFDERADIVQIGTVAAALLLGRPLDTSDYPNRLNVLLDEMSELTVPGDRKPLSPALHSWLERALPLEAGKPFETVQQANVALEQLLIKERRLGVAPAALRSFISRYLSHTGDHATEAHETRTDQLAQPAEIATADGPVPSNEGSGSTAPQRKVSSPRSEARASLVQNAAARPPVSAATSLTSAVIEADPDVEGPFAVIPLEIVPETVPGTVPEVGPGIITEVVPGTVPEGPPEAHPGLASATAADVIMEVTSELDTGSTVEIASALIAETAVERVEVDAPPMEVEIAAAVLEPPDPLTAAVSHPVPDEGSPQESEPARPPAGKPDAPAPESGEPVPGTTSDDVWVIDPSDLTFDPAFLDGLYQPARPDRGPLVPGPLRKLAARPAVMPSPQSASGPCVAPAGHAVEDESAIGPPTTKSAVSESDAQPPPVPATEAAPPALATLPFAAAPVAAEDEAVVSEGPAVGTGDTQVPGGAVPAASVAPALEPLEVLPALDASWPFVEESPAPVDELVARLASKSGAAPIAEPPVSLSPIAPRVEAPAPAAPAAEIVPAAIPAPPATRPAPTSDETAPPVAPVPAAEPVLAPIAAPAAEVAAQPIAQAVAEVLPEAVAEAVAPEGPLDATEPLHAAPPPASVAPALEPLEVLPALDASWPFVEESLAPVADLVAKLVSKTIAAPIAEPPVSPSPIASPVEARAPAALAVAEILPEAVADAVAPQRPPDVALPPEREETPPAELVSDAPAPASTLAAAPAGEDSGIKEAADAFERLLASLGETLATPSASTLPEPTATPLGVWSEAPAGTLELATTLGEGPARQAVPHDRVSASAGAGVVVFEPSPFSSRPVASAPTEEAPPAPGSPRLLLFSLRGAASRLAWTVPRRLIEVGRTRLRWRQIAAAAVVLVALGGVRLATAYWFKSPPPTGDLIVETVPDGLEVFVDNALRGRSPMSVTLPAGDHVLELRGKGLSRTLPVRIAPGIQTGERLSWPLSARTGRLRVESEPARANVSIDGEPRGVTPLTIEDLPARVHTLVVQGRGGRVERSVTIEPEQTTTIKVPVFPGWMKVFSPFDLRVVEGGRLLGTTDLDRIMLRAGRHEVEFVNEGLGYRVVRQVDITPGALTPVSIEPANGTLQIDGPPGFEVWLDGERVGETPLAPLQVSLGTHDVRFKHPQSGEQRQTVVVTQREPARVTAESK